MMRIENLRRASPRLNRCKANRMPTCLAKSNDPNSWAAECLAANYRSWWIRRYSGSKAAVLFNKRVSEFSKRVFADLRGPEELAKRITCLFHFRGADDPDCNVTLVGIIGSRPSCYL